ncbi:hypothetical protein LPN04_28205 [Rugamonas sp. A1-17]|nr:hypothetical protein [Rugamonas sp. A1-17]
MINITFNITEDNKSVPGAEKQSADVHLDTMAPRIAQLETKHNELLEQMGDHIQPFRPARMGGYMSHFMITLEFLIEPVAGKIISIYSPPAAQTVSWGDPFIYKGPEESHSISIPMPSGSNLSNKINETDFFERPAEFFQPGKETVWLQILNLDATMEHPEIGKIRIILGETLKREYPDLFLPSLGAAQALGNKGFPARLFFNPCAIIETPFGNLRAIHGILSYGRVTAFPPIGTPVSISKMIDVEDVEELRQRVAAGTYSHKTERDKAVARIVALSHPIDNEIHLEGQETFEFVERLIAQNYPGKDSAS